MKKSLLLLILCSFGLLTKAQTVKYLSSGADLQAEVDAGVAGDTFILGAGSYSGNIALTKKVTLIGPGYFNSSGPSGEAIILGSFSINAGSENSLITGLSIDDNVFIAASDIIFKRNKVSSTYFYVGRTSTLTNQLTLNNFEIKENYITSTGGHYWYGVLTNFLFQNNIVTGDMNCAGFNNSSTGSFINNVFGAGSISGQGNQFNLPSNSSGLGIEFINNIFAQTQLTNSNNIFGSNNYVPNVFKYNVMLNTAASYTSVTVPVNNSYGNDLNTIFAGFPANAAGLGFDEQYILSPSSPAKNYGREAPYALSEPTTDAGVFGNVNPYVISGIPVGPYIYQLSVPDVAATNSVVPVTIKAKSNN